MTMPKGDDGHRIRVHTRTFAYECYRRDDGLWDIEAELRDVKDQDYLLHTRTLAANEPVHHMRISLTVDTELTILGISSNTFAAPFSECSLANDPMAAMVGVKMSAGWRRAIEERLGGLKGCTHLRDLLFNAATAAFQGVVGHGLQLRIIDGAQLTSSGDPPAFLGKCMTYALDGPVVQRYEPMFYVPRPPAPETSS